VFEGDPFTALAYCLQPFNPVKLPQLPPGIGGLFGFWGYELIRWIEPRVPIHADGAADLPDGLWMQIDQLLIFDQVSAKSGRLLMLICVTPKILSRRTSKRAIASLKW
jgi:anthranilate synthase component 1